MCKVFVLNEDKVKRFTEEDGYEFERKGRSQIFMCEDHFDDCYILR